MLRRVVGRRIKINLAKRRPRKLEMLSRREPLILASAECATHVLLDVGLGRRAPFIQCGLDRLLHHLLASIADLTPFRQAATTNAYLIKCELVRALDMLIIRPSPQFAAILRGIRFIRHPHFSADDDAQTIDVGFVGGAPPSPVASPSQMGLKSKDC
jgi:hypothetical protein